MWGQKRGEEGCRSSWEREVPPSMREVNAGARWGFWSSSWLTKDEVHVWVWEIVESMCWSMNSPYGYKVRKILHFGTCASSLLISRSKTLLKVSHIFGFEYIQDLTKYFFCRLLSLYKISLLSRLCSWVIISFKLRCSYAISIIRVFFFSFSVMM